MSSKKIAILYGSETGNAHDFAKILSYKLNRLHFKHTLSSLGDYNPQDILSCRYLFIICSTTGQGELPRNVLENSIDRKKFTLWSFLKKKELPKDFLNHINIALLGLGDFSYPKFNYAIKMIHERLVNQLGAIEMFNRLEADEISMAGSNKGSGSGIESVYYEYEKRALELLLNKFPTRRVNGESIPREEIGEDFYLQPISSLIVDNETTIDHNNKKFINDSSVKYGVVAENTRITTTDHFQDVRKFLFKAADAETYSPGDTAAIFPYNSDESVERFLASQTHWLGVADKPMKFTAGIPPDLLDGGIIKPLTLRNLLKYHFDITSLPRCSFFLKIWTFAIDSSRLERGEEQLKDQREKLLEFSSVEDMEALFDYCNRPRRSILEVLEDFESIRLPWEFAADYLPIIKPRLYSLSSYSTEPNLELTIAVVKYKTILRKIRLGLCTTYMSELKAGDKLRYKLYHNNLLVGKDNSTPWILVSPGVGLAPMLSFIKSDFATDTSLIFGNRFYNKDYLYKDLLEEWSKAGKIDLYTVFSRDRENSPDTKYVQDELWKRGEHFTNLLVKQKGYFYICGSSGKMPVQVRLTLVEMLKKWGGFSTPKEAELYLSNMEKENRYLQETW